MVPVVSVAGLLCMSSTTRGLIGDWSSEVASAKPCPPPSPGAPKALQADLTGGQEVTLRVTDNGNGNSYDHADWAQPVITCTDPRCRERPGAGQHRPRPSDPCSASDRPGFGTL
ncbi:NPCBM/NEW2 domain-containing protein [Kitasatospora indigofera]|uniref:NPCBM/NEW2 domain-containing protein n=1 Tax=Kitasatospora indigofera TaxID=67307 RepID=UPI0033B6176A